MNNCENTSFVRLDMNGKTFHMNSKIYNGFSEDNCCVSTYYLNLSPIIYPFHV